MMTTLSHTILPLMNKEVLLILKENSIFLDEHGKLVKGVLRGFKCKKLSMDHEMAEIHLRVKFGEKELWIPVHDVADVIEP